MRWECIPGRDLVALKMSEADIQSILMIVGSVAA